MSSHRSTIRRVGVAALLGFVLAGGLVGQVWAGSQAGGLPGLRDEVESLAGRVEALEKVPDAPCYDNQNRYVDCGNGTVTDTVTGFIWTKDAGCISPRNYTNANNTAAALGHGVCGLTDNSRPGDWHIPTKAEWQATIEEAVSLGCTLPNGPSLTDTTGTMCFAIGAQPFINFDNADKSLYWSSTSKSDEPDKAWSWNTNGTTTANGPKGLLIQGWAVRGGH